MSLLGAFPLAMFPGTKVSLVGDLSCGAGVVSWCELRGRSGVRTGVPGLEKLSSRFEQMLTLIVPQMVSLSGEVLHKYRILTSVLIIAIALNVFSHIAVQGMQFASGNGLHYMGPHAAILMLVGVLGLGLLRFGWEPWLVSQIVTVLLLTVTILAALKTNIYYKSPVIHVFAILPVLQLMVNGLRSGLVWAFICFAINAVLYVIMQNYAADFHARSLQNNNLYHSITIVWVIAFIVMACKQYEKTGEIINQKLRSERNNYEYAATHDALTGLLKRHPFHDATRLALAEAQLADQSAVLIYIDLDGFKAINDQCGHHAGNAVLCHVARVIRDNTRRGDLVTRLGGDEFAVLMRAVDSPRDVEFRARKISSAIQKPFVFENTQLQVGASLGVSRFPEDGGSVQVLSEVADSAMYKAKNAGKAMCFARGMPFNFSVEEFA